MIAPSDRCDRGVVRKPVPMLHCQSVNIGTIVINKKVNIVFLGKCMMGTYVLLLKFLGNDMDGMKRLSRNPWIS